MDRLQHLVHGHGPLPASKQPQILGTEQQRQDHHRRETTRLKNMNLLDVLEDQGGFIITPIHEGSE